MNPVMWDYLGKPFYQPVERPELHWSNEASLGILILGNFFCQLLLNLHLDNCPARNWLMGIWEEALLILHLDLCHVEPLPCLPRELHMLFFPP